MQTITSEPNLMGRRLVGAVLYALLWMPVSLPVMINIAGLAVGPQALREKIIFLHTEFAAFHGRTGMYLVILATVALLTLYNLARGPQLYDRRVRKRARDAWNWGLASRRFDGLFDDSISAREKTAAVLTSGWGRFLLACDLGWIVLAALVPH